MGEADEKLTALRIQHLEAELAKQASPKPKDHFWANPAILAIIGAVCTASFGLITNKNQLDANRQLERDKLESSLILKATDSNDPEQRISALKFLVKAGLISDRDKKIDALKSEDVPQIKPPVSAVSPAQAQIQAQPVPVPSSTSALIEGLIAQTNDDIKSIRLAAVAELIKTHNTNPFAVEMALKSLSPSSAGGLTSEGRINLLFFLKKTNEVAWTSESIQKAKDLMKNIRNLYGFQTKDGAEILLKFLDEFDMQVSAK